MRGIAAVVVGLSGLLAASLCPAGASPAPVRAVPVLVTGEVAWSPRGPGLLAFGAEAGGRQGIAVARPDGSALRLLTPSPDPDPRAGTSAGPVWAPAGDRLAFRSAADDGSALVRVIGRDGSGLRTVARGDAPSWAPDGRRLAFRTFDPTASPVGLDVADLRTGAARTLVPWASGAPAWAPRGELVAFSSDRGSGEQVYLVRADGGGLRRLAAGRAPTWSSDGRLLAYDSGGSVRVIRPDGTGGRRLDGVPAGGVEAWAPGRRLLAVLRGDGPYERRGAFVVDVASGRVRRVLGPARASAAFGPSWSPRGDRLAFVTRTRRIWVVRADGGGGHVLRLSAAGLLRSLAWRSSGADRDPIRGA